MGKIPQIDSIEELARFWDTHDLTDFEDALEEVREPVFGQDDEAIVRIRLLPDQVEALKRMAQSKGVDEADLVREWINERLRVG